MRLEEARSTDLRWVRHAVRHAQLGTGRMRHGAVLYRSGRLLAVGRNQSRVQDAWVLDRPREGCSVHAEIAALRGLDARGATVLVVRVNRAGILRPSAPCPACWDALQDAGVRRVVHS